MSRVKGGVIHTKHRRGILKFTKGYRWGRKSKLKLAKTARMKAGQHAYVSRRTKKRINRGLWQVHINTGARAAGLNYSRLTGAMKKKNIALNRRVLAELANEHPGVFAKVIEAAK